MILLWEGNGRRKRSCMRARRLFFFIFVLDKRFGNRKKPWIFVHLGVLPAHGARMLMLHDVAGLKQAWPPWADEAPKKATKRTVP